MSTAKTLSSWLISFIFFLLAAVHPPNIASAENLDATTENNTSDVETIALPAIFRTPETGAGVGVGLFILGAPQEGEQGSRSDATRIGAIYTEKKQFVLRGQIERFSLDGRNQMLISAFAQKYPDSFFGIGPNTNEEDEEKYLSLAWEISGRLTHRFYDNIYVGGQVALSKETISDLKPIGLLDRRLDQNERPIIGTDPVVLDGGGIIARWDSRDDVEDPDQGFYAELNWLKRVKMFGSNHEFNTMTVDVRGFIPLSNGQRPVRYAGQFLAITMDGRPPFQSLAQLGGRDRLRGYFLGRYRERKLLLMQHEIRMTLVGPWGLVAYSGIGNVGANWSEITTSKPKPAWGLGARYRIATNQRMNLRLDFAWNDDASQPSYYLSLAEAF